MESNKYVINNICRDITETNLQMKAIIQDINLCTGPLSKLYELNSAGRSKIALIRKHIDKLSDIAKENKDKDLLKQIILYREQLSSSMEGFRNANIKSMLAIEKCNKENLFQPANEETSVRHREKRDKNVLAKMSSNVTTQLLSISRQLADTTQKSAETLGTLGNSSTTVLGTQEELLVTGSTITQSGKLLAKYGRREFTDKILLFFAFAFFIACVLYIIQKRLF